VTAEYDPACWQWTATDAARGVATSLDVGDFMEARELLFAWQDNRCALCGRRDDALIVDHCHRTSAVRGLLCRSCNVIEGRAGTRNPRVNAYRSRPPAEMLGLEVIYHDLHGPVPPSIQPLDPESEETQEAIQGMFARLSSESGDKKVLG
jgi:hypothetical protein